MKLEEAIKSNKFTDERHKATLNVLYTAYWLKNNLSSILKSEDLTIEQYNVLRILKGIHPGQMCVKDIASRIIEKSSNVPRIIDRLVFKKLAKRYPSKVDKRETLVSLTDRGLAVLAKSTDIIDDYTRNMSSISEGDASALNELLEKLRTT